MREEQPEIYPPIDSPLEAVIAKSGEKEPLKFRLSPIPRSERNMKLSDVITLHKDELCTREELEVVATWLTGSMDPLQMRIRQHMRFLWGKPEPDPEYGIKYLLTMIHGMHSTVENLYFGNRRPQDAAWMESDRKALGQDCLVSRER
jgi:hypothetical protein